MTSWNVFWDWTQPDSHCARLFVRKLGAPSTFTWSSLLTVASMNVVLISSSNILKFNDAALFVGSVGVCLLVLMLTIFLPMLCGDKCARIRVTVCSMSCYNYHWDIQFCHFTARSHACYPNQSKTLTLTRALLVPFASSSENWET